MKRTIVMSDDEVQEIRLAMEVMKTRKAPFRCEDDNEGWLDWYRENLKSMVSPKAWRAVQAQYQVDSLQWELDEAFGIDGKLDSQLGDA